MERFTWSDRHSVGVEAIDAQHQSLMELLNECSEQVDRHQSTGIDANLVYRLKQYVVFHFRYEESLMRAVGYSELPQHLALHEHFESRVRELETIGSGGGPGQLETLVSFLRDWYVNHILGADRGYAPFVKAATGTAR